MKAKRKIKINAFDTVNTIIMVLLMMIMLYPVLYIFSMSVSEPEAVYAERVKLFPIGFTFHAYEMVFGSADILHYYLNTIFYAVVGTAGMLLVVMLAAYPLSRAKFILNTPFTIFMSITMFFGGGLVPSFMVNKMLGLYDTRWIMVLPGMVSAWNIIIARIFIKDSIGETLIEAAQIDGYNDIRILFKIIFPLSMPIIAYLALGSLVGHWNGYFSALIYLPTADKHPIQLYLVRLLITNSEQMAKSAGGGYAEQARYATLLKYAAIMVTITPILCVYPFLQKYFVKGIMIGSIKG